jgi:hypothetical protein
MFESRQETALFIFCVVAAAIVVLFLNWRGIRL